MLTGSASEENPYLRSQQNPGEPMKSRRFRRSLLPQFTVSKFWALMLFALKGNKIPPDRANIKILSESIHFL